MTIRFWPLIGAMMLGACNEEGELVDAGVDAGAGVDASAAADAAADAGADADADGLLFGETFDVDGDGWPAGWTALGGVASATVVGGRGRLVPVVSGYTLARMGHALPPGTVDVDVRFTLSMTDGVRQGVGLGVRQNGGHLGSTTPPGAGYAVFVEAFRGPMIGAWREVNGVESPIRLVSVPPLVDGTVYAVRLRVAQGAGLTTISGRIWPAGMPEPAAWNVEATDTTASLQDAMGGVAIDAWNTATPGNGPTPAPIFVDDLEIRAW